MQAVSGRGTWLKRCRSAPELYHKQSPDQQARLLKLISSNSTWDGGTLTPTYEKPFYQMAEGLLFVSGGAEGVPTPSLRRLAQTLENLTLGALDGLTTSLAAA